MNDLLIMVIGLGSMGKRRIRLLKQISNTVSIIGIDSNKERMAYAEAEYHVETFSSISTALALYKEKINGVFVCTSPLSHSDIIYNLLCQGLNVFSEINLVSDGYDRLLNILTNNQVLFLSSTFLYRKDIQYLISKVHNQKVNYIYHTGQYLPDWHPWEDYKNFFVSDIRSNGCREIMAIEMPWISKCFGNIRNYSMVKGQLSKLDLSYDDNYMFLIEHENGTKGMIAVDIVARKPRRALEIYNENIQLFWEGTPDSLVEYDINKHSDNVIKTYDIVDKDKNYCDNIIENAYMDEILAFLEAICNDNTKHILYTFEDDKKLLDILDDMGI